MAQATDSLRVSHAERGAAIEILKNAYADGRLEREELDERVQLAMTARTRGELDRLLADLSPWAPQVTTEAAPAPADASGERLRVVADVARQLLRCFSCGAPPSR
ncbi:MAG TPA: DUF1707 domain-containing protein [Actinomycetota bacterium]|jgi:hypothetical protein|nr:DUF1707 domain-containing protein [Actinomycetota bacterium]